jgi:hypothetical protein
VSAVVASAVPFHAAAATKGRCISRKQSVARSGCRRQFWHGIFDRTGAASEPRNHRDVHAVAFRYRGQRFARSAALDRFDSLVVTQLALAAEFDAGGHGPFPPFASTLAN